MCGNFGLLALGLGLTSQNFCSCLCLKQSVLPVAEKAYEADYSERNIEHEETISVVKILEAQTACTEIRGGQAGGFSSIEYSNINVPKSDPLFGAEVVSQPKMHRVRMVARKRHPLAADLSKLYLKDRRGSLPDPNATVTVIGHTRFATSSINKVSELHPHEWVPFHNERVWLFNAHLGKFETSVTQVGIHITHNGDFDAMEAYQQTMVVNEIGLWLERVLHCPNNTRGDSPKIAGCMDLMRVQGRWAAAARLSWIRVALASAMEVAGGDQLSKAAPNTFPDQAFWERWGDWFDNTWKSHINNIIKVLSPNKFETNRKYQYQIDDQGQQQFVSQLLKLAVSECTNPTFGLKGWPQQKIHAFIHHTVRGFLRADLYTALTELLSRAEGSFGIQSHCTLEPGVVVIASKGQPMSVAYDPHKALVLFASEATALAVPVYKSGKWLPERIDLDSHGEIFRLGEPRPLVEGNFSLGVKETAKTIIKGKTRKEAEEKLKAKLPYLLLDCGVEIRCYSLVSHIEIAMSLLLKRSVSIPLPATPYDPSVDLVGQDIKDTPAVLAAIDAAWSNPKTKERVAGQSLAENLVRAMQRRVQEQKDTTDLLIGGVEVSLWLGEQLAADLRRIFPNLNVSTVSANKLIGVGDENANKVFFPGSDEILTRRIDSNTCVLMISQSGQTFPTLHATRKMAKLAFGKVWILTGCFNSKMEQAITESYVEHASIYGRDRVFYNYAGHRPAEPSSVAVAATWHTLTRFLIHMVDTSRKLCPGGRMIHLWEQDQAARIIQYYITKYGDRFANQKKKEKINKVLMDKFMKFNVNSSRTPSMKRKGNKLNDTSFSSDVEEFEMKDHSDSDDDTVIDNSPAPLLKNTSGKGGGSSRQISRRMSTLPSKALLLSSENKGGGGNNNHKESIGVPQVVMSLSDGCIKDIKSLTFDYLIPNVCEIVGYDPLGKSLPPSAEKNDVHSQLVKKGKQWAEHINEPWHMIVLVAIYIFLSVGLGITLFCAIGDAVAAILRNAGVPIGYGALQFSLRHPDVIANQPLGYTLVGLALQIIDAAWFVWLGKNFTRFTRILHGRPLAARHGKRTIVIVDTPTVHQLTEIFVSKLFSQSYSIVSVDVHGASGLDHFVHRFTHRVARGLLIALGRPDGRLACLAKSEASLLLSAKQAAFIRNPDYNFEGAGPEFITIGHNPFVPNLGLADHVVLPSTEDSSSVVKRQKYTARRRKFVDEYIFDRLFYAQKPFTIPVMRALRRAMESGSSKINSKARTITASSQEKLKRKKNESPDEMIPYGVHHIDPWILINSGDITDSVLADFILESIEILKQQKAAKGEKKFSLPEKSADPAVRLAFSSKLDTPTRQVQDLQVVVQQFYECRIASLERYIAFCVMFHTMAKECAAPWFLYPWDIARSQSNLRVATTASPISAGGGSEETTQEVKKVARQMAFVFRKFYTNF